MAFSIYKKLENEINIDGKIYPVNITFDNVLRLYGMLNNYYMTQIEPAKIGIEILLGTNLDHLKDEDQIRIYETLIKNFVLKDDDIEAPRDLAGNVMPEVDKPIYADLHHDAGYIYSSFMHAYNIDLFDEQEKLDWRKFKILLRDLPEDTKLRIVINIRRCPLPKGKGMHEEINRLREMKRIYASPGVAVD